MQNADIAHDEDTTAASDTGERDENGMIFTLEVESRGTACASQCGDATSQRGTSECRGDWCWRCSATVGLSESVKIG